VLLDLYSRCFATLYSPINEDFGLIPLESLSSSKPCIAINEGGPKETVADAKDGFLINDIEEMADKMHLLSNNPDLTEEMGKEGRKKVESRFTWRRFLQRFREKSNELIKQQA
jgi:glycosyltransferase involved in cell wall biosynthesis